MSQNALSVVTYVKPSERDALERVLDVIGNDVRGAGANTYVSFAELTTVHFACWVVLRSTPDSANPANVYPDTLVLEMNFDGDLAAHLDEIVTKGGKALDAVYGHCVDWPARGSADRNAVVAYLRQHSVATTAFYVGCPGHTVGDIQNARAVREELATFLDGEEQAATLSGAKPRDILTRIQQYLATRAQMKPVVSQETLDAQGRRGIRNAILAALIGVPIVIVASPLLLVWYVALRIRERRDAQLVQSPLPVDPRLFGKEDVFTQNHLTTLVDVKPGTFRLGTLKAVLWLVNILAKTVFIDGQLGGIPSIHFARWLFLENDRRLLFFSNYDGSWASYLGDFVDKANYGLTAVWSNTDRFPASKHLAFGGAQHIEAFKQWSRQHNVYAAVWYSAYPQETIQNLRSDIRIRDSVLKDRLGDSDVAALLQRF
ncbi:MAG: hypothetical protein ABI647_01535 [Gemmatimonadota bacterium]